MRVARAVIPAQAGTQAGGTGEVSLGPRLRGNDDR
jgi:hypothetical protein